MAVRDFCIGEQPEYRPFRDLRSVLEASKGELGFFHFLEIVTGWLVPSVGQKIQVQSALYLNMCLWCDFVANPSLNVARKL
jgi:hypothetical protein